VTSSATFPLDANTVRDFLSLETDSTSRYTNTTIGSNIRSAVGILERLTHRYIADRTTTLTFTTQGDMTMIPGLRTATSVVRSGATLVAGSSYYLHPDAQQSGLSTGISFGQSSGREPSYLGNPEWFDRNLDTAFYRNHYQSTLPNDLVIAGTWGYAAADTPDECLMAVKVMAGYLTKLADTNMAGFLSTPEGNAFDLSAYPPVVQDFVATWRLGSGVGGA
jgi:hypothetical protein